MTRGSINEKKEINNNNPTSFIFFRKSDNLQTFIQNRFLEIQKIQDRKDQAKMENV